MMTRTYPFLIINTETCKTNINKMLDKCRHLSAFRPHFKTHRSLEIARLFRDAGIRKITVSSPEMAVYFASQGWQDICIAMPFSIHWSTIVNTINPKTKLTLLVEDVLMINEMAQQIHTPCDIMLKIDTGNRRTGIDPRNTELIELIINRLTKIKHFHFKGFLTHAGHTYRAKSKEEIRKIYFESHHMMAHLKSLYLKDHPDIIISYGDTPSCSIIETLDHFDEYRPGNFIFYDLMQKNLGVCLFQELAAILACPVLALHKERLEIIIHGGAIHLSKDDIVVDGRKVYGELVLLNPDNSWTQLEESVYLTALSQEHGTLQAPTSSIFDQIKIGQIVGIIPVHSCLLPLAHADILPTSFIAPGAKK